MKATENFGLQLPEMNEFVTPEPFNANFEALDGALARHTEDADNPHGVTAKQVGAATASHTHTPASIGAAAVGHTHTPASIGAAASVVTGSYTGNGDASTRTINVGGEGSVLAVWYSGGMRSLVMPKGSITGSGSGCNAEGASVVKFEDGVLTLSTTLGAFNTKGQTYTYQVL